jgi:hypothetical protein
MHMLPPSRHVPEHGSRPDHDLPNVDPWPYVDVLKPAPIRRPNDDLVRFDAYY